MARLPKLALPLKVYYVTTSVEQGVMLPANPMMVLIIKSILARAQTLYNIEICDLIVNGTHLHMISLIYDPDNLKNFMKLFKTESAHAINRLLGRKKRTVWCQGYDSPVLEFPADIIEKIAYIYSNPAKDNLEDSIERYPGLNTWNIRQHCSSDFKYLKEETLPCITRKTVPKNIGTENGYSFFSRQRTLLERNVRSKQSLKITPNAWMKLFGITEPKEVADYNHRIAHRVKQEEATYRESRAEIGKPVMGAAKLRSQGINPNYMPSRDGRRSWIHCLEVSYRKQFISEVKLGVQRCREVYERWKQGDFVPYPIGFYAPALPRTANLLPDYIRG